MPGAIVKPDTTLVVVLLVALRGYKPGDTVKRDCATTTELGKPSTKHARNVSFSCSCNTVHVAQAHGISRARGARKLAGSSAVSKFLPLPLALADRDGVQSKTPLASRAHSPNTTSLMRLIAMALLSVFAGRPAVTFGLPLPRAGPDGAH